MPSPTQAAIPPVDNIPPPKLKQMPVMNRRLFLAAALTLPFCNIARAMSDDAKVQTFIGEVAEEHGFDSGELRALFSRLSVNRGIINLMDAPAGKRLEWKDYRNNIVNARRIREGRNFMRKNRKALTRASKQYGVPSFIIAAILGIETNYGGFLGDYGVMESLATLAFYYPRRADEFRRELESFLLYTREANINPLNLRGSFAGAFGMPQFLPSSARLYAVDFDNDGNTDLFAPADAIGSIGNFLAAHGWRQGHGILYKLQSTPDNAKAMLAAGRAAGYRPTFSINELRANGARLTKKPLRNDEQYLLVDLPNQNDTEYRAGTANFYALTRYNKSFKYAAAVFDLSAAISHSP